MCDVDDIIDYMKSLKKGFDKDLFQSKIEELAHAVDTTGLEYDDFHTLFKVWLNLSIPITKWASIGICLVPRKSVTDRTVLYALQWLMANNHYPTNFSRINFLLDWLTAAMDCESIDIATLDKGYETFFSMLSYEVLASHALKLVYTLTKPDDVTRRRVLELFDYARKREGKQSMCRQLQVLLGLFKSYKPELVPEDIPAVPIYTTFRSNLTLSTRFKRNQEDRNDSKENYHLLWANPMLGGRNKKAEILVPSIEFINIGSSQYAGKVPQMNYLDFTDPASLLQCRVLRPMSRPARLRALLRNNTGLTLLALAPPAEHAFLEHDLHYMLTGCFLDASPHSEAEKRDFLHRLAALQRTLLRAVPVLTTFLAHYLPLWDERRYFAEILELMEWIDVENTESIPLILECMIPIYHRALPIEQCAILRSLSNMYTNVVYASTRSSQYFVRSSPSAEMYSEVLSYIASSIARMCGNALQVNPRDLRILYSNAQAAVKMGTEELRHGSNLGALPTPLALGMPLLMLSAALVDKMAALIILYQKLILKMKSTNKIKRDQLYVNNMRTLKGYTSDVFRCFVDEDPFTGRQKGFVFSRLHPQAVGKMIELIPDADTALSIRNNLALSPYTYLQMEEIDYKHADNEFWFGIVVNTQFTHLYELLTKLGWGRKMQT